MGQRYEKSRKNVSENQQTVERLRSDRDTLQKEYAPLSLLDSIRGLLDDEAADAIQGVSAVGEIESQKIASETDTAEEEKKRIANEIDGEIAKLNAGLKKLRGDGQIEFGKKAMEKGGQEYKKQIDKYKILMEELRGYAADSGESAAGTVKGVSSNAGDFSNAAGENPHFSAGGSVESSGAMTGEEPGDAGGTDAPDWERTSMTASEEELLREMDENGEIDVPETKDAMPDPEHSELHLPDESGEFLGERGNSEFRPEKEEALEEMRRFGRETVEYRDGYPDFSPFTAHDSPWGKLDCQVEIGHMTDQRENPTFEYGSRPKGAGHDPDYDLGNFAQADNSLLERVREISPDATAEDVVRFRKENRLTWHECADGKTMQLVPTQIHNACRHSGGVSEMKYRMAWGDVERPDETHG